MKLFFPNKTYELEEFVIASDNELSALEKETKTLIINWLSDDLFLVFKTSGSTGIPKEIFLEKSKIKASSKRTLNYFNVSHPLKIMNVLSVQYIGGAMQLIRALIGDLDYVALELSSNPFQNAIVNFSEIGLLSVVPLQLNELSRKHISDLSNVKNILIGGAQLPETKRQSLIENGLVNCFETYGMTETISHVAIRLITSESFQAMPEVLFSVDQDSALKVDDKLLRIESLQTNDVVNLLNEKKFVWKGRRDFVINSGGKKFLIEELERDYARILRQHSFMVLAIPDEKLGQKIGLIIEGEKEGMTNISFEELHAHHRPKEIFFIDKMIRTESGKIDRRKNEDLIFKS